MVEERFKLRFIEGDASRFTLRGVLPPRLVPPIGSVLKIEPMLGSAVFAVVCKTHTCLDQEYLDRYGDTIDDPIAFIDQTGLGTVTTVELFSIAFADEGNEIRSGIPPRPPVFIEAVSPASAQDLVPIFRKLSHLTSLLGAKVLDELIPYHLVWCAERMYGSSSEQRNFLRRCMQHIVWEIPNEIRRSERILLSTDQLLAGHQAG